MHERTRFGAGRSAVLGMLFCAIVLPLFVVSGCGEQLTRMEENQAKLQAMVAANARQLATVSSQIHAGDGKLNASIQNLDADTQQVAAKVTTIHSEQLQLHEAVAAGNQRADKNIARLEDNQGLLRDGVAQLSETTGRTAADVKALAGEHTALRETIGSNQQELNKSIGTVASNQDRIQTSVLQLQQADRTLAGDFAAIAGKQDELQAALQDNDRQLAAQLSALATGQEQLCADILNVHTFIEVVSADLTALANEQTLSHAAQKDSTQALASTVEIVESNQRHLQAGVDQAAGIARRTAADVTVLADGQSAMQEAIKVSRDVLTGQMAASLQEQQAIQTAVQDLHGRTNALGAGIEEVAAGQRSFRETLGTNQDEILTAMAGLSDDQQAAQNQLNTLTATAGQTALDVLAMDSRQASLQQAMQADLGSLDEKADRTTAGLRAVAEQQTAIQRSVREGDEMLAARVTVLAEDQRVLKSGIGEISRVTQQSATNMEMAVAGQDTLRQAIQSHNEQIGNRLMGLAKSQDSLGSQLDIVTATAGQTSLDILELGDGQTTLQQAVQTGMDGLGERTNRMAADLQDVAAGQTVIRDAVKANHDALSTHAATAMADRQVLRMDIDSVSKKSDTMTADLTRVASAQASLDVALKNHTEAMNNRMAALADSHSDTQTCLDVLTATAGQTSLDVLALSDGQQQMSSGLDILTATAGQTGLDVIDIAGRQEALRTAVQDYRESTDTRTAKLADTQTQIQGNLDVLTATAGQTSLDVLALSDAQQQMSSGMDILTATAGQTALDLIDIAAGQERLRTAVRDHSESADTRTAKLADTQTQIQGNLDVLTATAGQTALDVLALSDGQQQMSSGLDILTAAAGQTGLDVIDIAGRQEALRTAVRDYRESTDTRTEKLADAQTQIQGNLDVLTATAGQTALDIIALNNGQAGLEQAVQNNNREVANKLTAIAQGQQDWLQGLDAAQAKVHTMAEGMTALEQQITTLQGALQATLENVATRVDVDGRQQEELGAKISQDVQAMIEAVSQLRQMQTTLREQMSQVQKSTQSQAENIKAAIDQMKQPPAELKVSDAATKAMVPVVPAGE